MLKKHIFKFFILIILTLITLITLKSNNTYKNNFYKYVYTTNISFASINNWYNSKFGSPLPFSDFFNNQDTIPVFNETLKYQSASKYKNGVELKVDYEYLVPSLDSGIIIFIGEKEEYGKTVIVQQENGVDVWYSNLNEINVKLYDYIKKGSLIGNTNEKLYLVFNKNGEPIDYQQFI